MTKLAGTTGRWTIASLDGWRSTRRSAAALVGLMLLATMAPLAPAFGPAPVTVPDGLVAWWKGEDSFADEMGAHPGSGNEVAFADGLVGRAFKFSGGLSPYVEIPNTPEFSIGSDEAFTIELWAKLEAPLDPDGQPHFHMLGKRVGVCSGDINYQSYITPPDFFFHGLTAGPVITQNVWVHVAFTYNGTTLRIYAHGALFAEKAMTMGDENNAPLTLGSAGACGHRWHGLLDEVSFYSRALTGDEIRSIKDAAGAGKSFITITTQCNDGDLQGNDGWCLAPDYSYSTQVKGPWAVAGSELACELDSAGGLEPVPCVGTLTEEGVHTLNVTATNPAGNVVQAQATLKIDTGAPTCTGSFSGALGTNGWFTTTGSQTLTSSDATSGVASTAYALNGGPSTIYAGPFPITTQGESTVVCTVTDNAGNVASETFIVNVDTVAPTCTSSFSGTLGNDGWHTTTGLETLTASDATSGVASTTYKLNGGASVTYTEPFSLPSEGLNTVMCTVTDIAGNAASLTDTVKIDTVAPWAELTVPSWAFSEYDVLWQASDQTSGLRQVNVMAHEVAESENVCLVELSGQPAASGRCAYSQGGITANFHQVQVVDIAGNTAAYGDWVTVMGIPQLLPPQAPWPQFPPFISGL